MKTFAPFADIGPRITAGRTVLRRASWRTWARQRPAEASSIGAWANKLGLPRQAFYLVSSEAKRVYVDLQSPAITRNLQPDARPRSRWRPHRDLPLQRDAPRPGLTLARTRRRPLHQRTPRRRRGSLSPRPQQPDHLTTASQTCISQSTSISTTEDHAPQRAESTHVSLPVLARSWLTSGPRRGACGPGSHARRARAPPREPLPVYRHCSHEIKAAALGVDQQHGTARYADQPSRACLPQGHLGAGGDGLGMPGMRARALLKTDRPVRYRSWVTVFTEAAMSLMRIIR
jgi:hypothetical protein